MRRATRPAHPRHCTLASLSRHTCLVCCQRPPVHLTDCSPVDSSPSLRGKSPGRRFGAGQGGSVTGKSKVGQFGREQSNKAGCEHKAPQESANGGAAKSASYADDSDSIDPDLAAVIDAWPKLPKAVRAGIVAMVQAARPEAVVMRAKPVDKGRVGRGRTLRRWLSS